MERTEVRDFVRKHRKDSPGFVERKLWDIAELAPLGGHVIGSVGDPYLLRIYLTPRGPQFKWLWAEAGKYVDIGEYGTRPLSKVPRFFLHHFFRGDADDAVHNHPWPWSLSLILTEGYVEERWDPETKSLKTRHLYPGDLNIIRSTDFHKVTLKNPGRGCWSLFLATGRVEEKNGRDWGFLETQTEKYTPWGEWVDRRQVAATRYSGP